MRFFKYLILFSLFSTASNANFSTYGGSKGSTTESACKTWSSDAVYKKDSSSDPKFVGTCVSPTKGQTPLYSDTNCPSAIQKALSVSRNAGSYVCVQQCQYAIQGCVSLNFDSGNPDGGDRTKMSCNAISTGKVCTGGTNNGNTSNSPTTNNPGANSNNDGSQSSTNSSTSNSTSTNNSTSNSTTTTNTTNNTTNNTSTSTSTTVTNTTNVTNTTTNTTIDLSSLENTIVNVGNQIIKAVNDINKGGSGTGDPNGQPSSSSAGTDLTGINKKLDEINSNTKGSKESLDSIHKELTTDPGLGDGSGIVEIGQQQIDIPDQQYFAWSAQCPLSTGSTAISLNGESTSIDSDFSSWCKMAVDVRPFVLAAGAVIAFLIASGVWMGRGE